jgi:hypothetical protein
MHPLRKLRESGKPTPAQVSELLAENIVRPLSVQEFVRKNAATFTESAKAA